ncbi:transposable element Tcb1 transposase [Trichonephila clavipes]|nr:transposable element Tcb1 transposase [Trichonephila clavipes]
MVWEAIAYSTWSILVLIRGTMAAQRYAHGILSPHVLPLMQRPSGAIFNKTMLGLIRQGCHKTIYVLLLPILGLYDSQICLQSSISGAASWASNEFERTRCKVTANMERNVSMHHTELVCLNDRSYRIVHSL